MDLDGAREPFLAHQDVVGITAHLDQVVESLDVELDLQRNRAGLVEGVGAVDVRRFDLRMTAGEDGVGALVGDLPELEIVDDEPAQIFVADAEG